MSYHDNISRVYTARNSRSLKLGNTAFTPKMKMSGLRNHRLNIHHLYATDGKAGYFFVTSLFYSGMIWVYRMYSTGGPNGYLWNSWERYFPTDKMAMKKYNHVKYVILRNLSLEKEITIDISYTYFEINNSNI